MCYLVAKKADGIGSIALQTSYGQYEPYRFVDTEQEFEESLKLL